MSERRNNWTGTVQMGEELSKKRLILKNSAKISENLSNVVNNFNQEDPPGIITLLSGNIRILSKVSELLDPESKKMINNLESLYLEINEISEYFFFVLNNFYRDFFIKLKTISIFLVNFVLVR